MDTDSPNPVGPSKFEPPTYPEKSPQAKRVSEFQDQIFKRFHAEYKKLSQRNITSKNPEEV